MGTSCDNKGGGAELRFEDISKNFGGKAALSGVTFTLPAGSFAALIGESGCGKTTLLRVAAGFEKPDGGRVYIGGRDVTDLPPGERRCGTVFQDFALFPHMSAAGNIAFVLRARKRPGADGRLRRMSAKEARAEAEKLLDYLGLGGMAPRKASTLSGGEKQRVAIARAVATGADVLLLDEPTSALDGMSRLRFRSWLAELRAKTGVTVLCVTHDREEAMASGGTVCVMSEGRLLRTGSAEEVYCDPRSEEAARLTGPCGVLRGAVRGGRAVFPGGPEAVCDGEDGSAAEAYVRPENVAIGRDKDAGEYKGVVTACAFSGGGYAVTVNALCGRLEARSDVPYTEGEEIYFGIKDLKAVSVN